MFQREEGCGTLQHCSRLVMVWREAESPKRDGEML